LEFLDGLGRLTAGAVFLIGGAANAARAQNLIARSACATALNACDLKLAEAAALLHHADLFIGTDSGPMNLAVATATEAFALFGATPVLGYSKFIHAVVPQDGPSSDGMKQISPAQVLERVAPYLAAHKEPPEHH
jgi:ADP-heptose:LPS heptosyltransferase